MNQCCVGCQEAIKEEKKWRKDMQNYTKTGLKWQEVLMSDKSKYNVFSSNCSQYVQYRGVRESYSSECLQLPVKHGGGSISIWTRSLTVYTAFPFIFAHSNKSLQLQSQDLCTVLYLYLNQNFTSYNEQI